MHQKIFRLELRQLCGSHQEAIRKPYHVLFYSLPMILAIGYKVKGTRGVQFEK